MYTLCLYLSILSRHDCFMRICIWNCPSETGFLTVLIPDCMDANRTSPTFSFSQAVPPVLACVVSLTSCLPSLLFPFFLPTLSPPSFPPLFCKYVIYSEMLHIWSMLYIVVGFHQQQHTEIVTIQPLFVPFHGPSLITLCLWEFIPEFNNVNLQATYILIN